MSKAATPIGIGPVLRGHSGTLGAVLAVAGVGNLLALAGPLLVMAVYDTVIPARDLDLVLSFGVLAGLLVVADLGLRALRASTLARVGTDVERALGGALFEKLLALPLSQLTRSSTHQQLSRVRQFESMRDVFTGSLADAALDLPYVPLYFGVILLIAPQVAAALLVAALLLGAIALLTLPRQARLSQDAGDAARAHAAALREVADNHRAIRRAGLAARVEKRCADLATAAAEADGANKRFQSLCQAGGQSLVAFATAGAIALATLQAMAGAVSFGALIAVMTLSGRALGPVLAAASGALRARSLRTTARQADAVLTLDEEFSRSTSAARLRTFDGRLAAQGIVVRFDTAPAPALSGVTLDLSSGGMTILAGRSGAGKSTLLHTLSRLHVPVAGSVTLDGITLRQIAAQDLRHAIAYAVQNPAPPPGTVRAHVTSGDDTIDDAAIHDLFAAMGATREIRRLRHGLDTVLDGTARHRMSGTTLRTFALARCLLRPTPIRLIDDLLSGLPTVRARTIWDRMRADAASGTNTVVVTDRPEFMADADRIVVLADGRIVLDEAGVAGVARARVLLGDPSDGVAIGEGGR